MSLRKSICQTSEVSFAVTTATNGRTNVQEAAVPARNQQLYMAPYGGGMRGVKKRCLKSPGLVKGEIGENLGSLHLFGHSIALEVGIIAIQPQAPFLALSPHQDQ